LPEVEPKPILPQAGDLVRRHGLTTRLWHWINAVALLVLIMSGLMIFNAHPRLYWGQTGTFGDPAWLEIGEPGKGVAFPGWATLPSEFSLSMARNWHFAFGWVLALGLTLFLIGSLFNGHLKRDLHIRRAEWAPKHIWADIKSHAQLHFPVGAEALHYNVLQKLSYAGVIFLLLPAMIFSGLAMSPAMDAAYPWLLDIFGGRQSARSVHFICAFLLLSFFVVHMAMVLLAGPFNEVRSIITGWYRLPGERGEA
jgi:Ni/Fe-hydrogenase b-type cytochrome subunit